MNISVYPWLKDIEAKATDTLARGLQKFAVVLRRPATGRRRMVVFRNPRLYGEVACENGDGHAVVYVDAAEMLAWIRR
jgi:hypothetical protein